MYPLLAPIVLLIGLLLYGVSEPGKMTEIGRIMIWLGLGFTLWFYGAKY